MLSLNQDFLIVSIYDYSKASYKVSRMIFYLNLSVFMVLHVFQIHINYTFKINFHNFILTTF